MARHIAELAFRGCTEQCIPCHFREVWHRELDQESVSAFLEQDTEYTVRPVLHGETLLSDSWTLMPNGIFSEMTRLASVAGSEFIAIYLTIRYPALRWNFTEELVDRVLADVSERWITDLDGNPALDPSLTRRYEPSGHRIGSLPTTPVTPRNSGRPRSSHRTPPPIYSPGRSEGHPRQVIAPIALLERTRPSPPPYPSPPSYAEQNSTLHGDEFPDSSNDAMIDTQEFLANLDYILQPLGSHAPRPPARHGPWRARTGPFDRPGSAATARTLPRMTEYSSFPEAAPLGQSPIPFHTNVRTTLVSPQLHQRPTRRRTPRRRPPPIITSPNNIQPSRLRLSFRDSEEPEINLEQGQPTLYIRPSPFEEEFDSDIPDQEREPAFYMRPSSFEEDFDIDFSDHSNEPPRSTSMDWNPSEDVVAPSLHYGPTDSGSSPSSSASSSPDLNGDTNHQRRPALMGSPDNIANYRARQREARRRRREAELPEGEMVESMVEDEEFSDPDFNPINV